MNIPNPDEAAMSEPDKPEGLLDEIEEYAFLLAIYVKQITAMAMVNDLVGLGYATRKSWGYMKSIRASVKVLLPEEEPLGPEADRLEPVEPGDDVVPPWVEENGA